MPDSPVRAAESGRVAPALIDALQRALREQERAHRALLAALEARHDAMRRADAAALDEALREEKRVHERIVALERDRLEALETFATRHAPDRAGSIALAEVAAIVGGDAGERLLALGARARDAIEAAAERNVVLRQAADRLSAHLDGVLRAMQTAMNRARVYGRRGALAPAVAGARTLDLKS